MVVHVHAQSIPKPFTMVVFGDSITAGGALPADQRGQLWVKLVEAASAGDLKLINEGKGGRPTNSLKEFEEVLQRHPRPDALVIALGMNDSRDITDACVPKAATHISSMIEKARQTYGAEFPIMLIGPTNINKTALGPTKPIGDQREGKLKELGQAFADLANETGCDFMSLFGVVPDYALLKDGVHPDGEGNVAMAKVLAPALQAWAVKMSGEP
ncbi:SGNH/GDSL hydrolase family protein [Phragmitibacter flavus]|uniref:SGNH/GDSL hydrolase family protein n=1 Tax=Phragmitibacter flavus TaxID=2576071 RepID=A0A5R8KIY3_9BACT|nr:SGNH/GDSL hydrolase family protein [Phragmitibacter flavus]TLD72273.1 SGNH/GDSL hydrolase family protein [Phragmitibacter flavus]